MNLPTLTLTLREFDPDWEAAFDLYQNCVINTESMMRDFEIEVEVVQLNLNSNGMRVRYEWPSKRTKKGSEVKTRDVPIAEFFKHYEIKELA
jgi:hypothetical protein